MSSLHSRKAGYRLAASFTAIVLAGAAPVFAQDAPQSTEADTSDTVVITGSRIARPELSLPNPVQVVTSEAIEQSGKTNLTDFLSETPALLGSQTGIKAAGSALLGGSQNVGVNNLSLRNLGIDRTLVLVDGRRHVAGYPGTAAVDINTIPTDLVEKIDILTGGASAIYGADGVSGVVNFILKKDFDKFGYTERCPGCSALLRNIRQQPHTVHCRSRMYKAVESDARFVHAKQCKEDAAKRKKTVVELEMAVDESADPEDLTKLFEKYLEDQDNTRRKGADENMPDSGAAASSSCRERACS